MSWGFVFGRLLTIVLVSQLALVMWNLRIVVRPKPRAVAGGPKVSLLVPARNEAETIARCLRALLAQSYGRLEIIVLDDGSTDGTAAIVEQVGGERVRLVAGSELPSGWTGKNWACHQLAQAATGAVLCFVDADTVLAPDAVGSVVATLDEHGAGLVACLLHSETGGVAEAMLLPMINYAALGLFPTALIHGSPHPDLAVAFGPFLTVTRAAYDAAGGHAANPGHVVDDMQLARSVKAAGYDLRLVNGTELATTSWYHGLREIWRGFSKNAYGGIGYRPVLAALAVCVLTPLLVLPFVRVAVGLATGTVPIEALVQVGALLLGRLVTGLAGRDPVWTVPFHPLTVVFWAGALTWSMVLCVTGRSVMWKDRPVPVGNPSPTAAGLSG